MEFTGEIRNLQRDIQSGEARLTLSVNELDAVLNELDALKEGRLSVKLSKYRRRRSLDANAYFHLLVGKIAGALCISNANAKNILICRYGQPVILPDGQVMIYKTNAPYEYMKELETIHSIPVKYEDNATFYKIFRGSHEYDSAEMSALIRGTVEEAKAIGIDTMTPAELERILKSWRPRK